MEDLEFRKLDFYALKQLVGWAKEEGWNPGPFDADVFWATDPDGFYGYYFNGMLIAGGAIVSYNKEFGFMGLFIVRPEYRAKGIGRKLWYHRHNLLIDRLNNNASIAMDGVVDMQPFYRKGGFEIAFRDERYEKTGVKYTPDANISDINDKDIDKILQFDKQCFGFSRPQFLKPWINLPGNRNLKYAEDNKIRGFAIVRKAAVGFKIGPLFADNARIAEELYKTCLGSAIGEPVYLDIPLSNQEAVQLVKKYHAKYVFECARMYYGQAPETDTNKIFGITTFELG